MTETSDAPKLSDEFDADQLETIERYERLKDEIKAKEKEAEREREIKQIMAALAASNYRNQRDRVAAILSMYPEARNSDVVLALRYWSTFQPDLYPGQYIEPKNLFKLERQTVLSRIRAKIQNEYNLFPGSEKVTNARRIREQEVKAEMLEDKGPPREIKIFADETGKTQEWIAVGSIWFTDLRKSVQLISEISTLKTELNIKPDFEFHFSQLKRGQIDSYNALIELLRKHRPYMSIRGIFCRRAGTSRPIEETVQHLIRILVQEGFRYEVYSGRITPPRSITLVADEGALSDPVGRKTASEELTHMLSSEFGNECVVDEFVQIPSKGSPLLQVADIVTGLIGRALNKEQERSWKDDFANEALYRLGLSVEAPDGSEHGGDTFSMIELK